MPILSKLRFKPAAPLYVLGDVAGMATVQAEEGYTLVKKLPAKKEAPVEQAILFARTAADVQTGFASLTPHLAEASVFWIAYPKKTSAIKTDLNRDKGWDVVSKAGYVGVSQASLDTDWSAVWFKKTDALRSYLRGTPMHERKTEGIDYVARKVTLPSDAVSALEEHAGLYDFFNRLSFSHQREWGEAIAGARKPETRQRRIAKMVVDIQKQRTAKAEKQKQ